MKNRKLFIIMVGVLSVLILLIPGCRAIQRPAPAPRDVPQTPAPGVPSPQIPAPQAPAPESTREIREENMRAVREAEQIEETAENIDGVDEAYVVILGGTAWIGIELEENITAEQVKGNVRGMIRDRFPDITEVFVATDRNTVAQIRRIAEEVGRGRVAQDFRDELNRIADAIKRE